MIMPGQLGMILAVARRARRMMIIASGVTVRGPRPGITRGVTAGDNIVNAGSAVLQRGPAQCPGLCRRMRMMILACRTDDGS